jgi:hypothetical protein
MIADAKCFNWQSDMALTCEEWMKQNAVVIASEHDCVDSKTSEVSETIDGVSLETKQGNENGGSGLELVNNGAVLEASHRYSGSSII